MEGDEQIYVPCLLDEPLRQGEILSSLIQHKLNINSLSSSRPILDPIAHPFAIVVSQDCDLDWDYKARHEEGKIIPF